MPEESVQDRNRSHLSVIASGLIITGVDRQDQLKS